MYLWSEIAAQIEAEEDRKNMNQDEYFEGWNDCTEFIEKVVKDLEKNFRTGIPNIDRELQGLKPIQKSRHEFVSSNRNINAYYNYTDDNGELCTRREPVVGFDVEYVNKQIKKITPLELVRAIGEIRPVDITSGYIY